MDGPQTGQEQVGDEEYPPLLSQDELWEEIEDSDAVDTEHVEGLHTGGTDSRVACTGQGFHTFMTNFVKLRNHLNRLESFLGTALF